MEYRFHTKAILYNPENKILVQKRSETGKRDLPGGRTEVPEKIEDAILREIQEETGITKVKNLKIIHLESDFSEETNRYFILIMYKGAIDALASEISPEHDEYRRVTKDELSDIDLTDYLKDALKKIKDLV